jgi:hypothetical protein
MLQKRSRDVQHESKFSFLDGLDPTRTPTTMMAKAKLVLIETMLSYSAVHSTKKQHQSLEHTVIGEIITQNI